jgi:hypothetical protein
MGKLFEHTGGIVMKARYAALIIFVILIAPLTIVRAEGPYNKVQPVIDTAKTVTHYKFPLTSTAVLRDRAFTNLPLMALL